MNDNIKMMCRPNRLFSKHNLQHKAFIILSLKSGVSLIKFITYTFSVNKSAHKTLKEQSKVTQSKLLSFPIEEYTSRNSSGN